MRNHSKSWGKNHMNSQDQRRTGEGGWKNVHSQGARARTEAAASREVTLVKVERQAWEERMQGSKKKKRQYGLAARKNGNPSNVHSARKYHWRES